MKTGLRISALLLVLASLFSASEAWAKLRNYTYPYDISQIEWEILNWTAAYRGTTKPADPFILDRMQYDRKIRKVLVYLFGKPDQATDENLNKSVDGITKLVQQRLSKFDPVTDLYVYYTLKEENKPDKYKEYRDGSFTDRSSPPEEPTPTPGYPKLAPPATSY